MKITYLQHLEELQLRYPFSAFLHAPEDEGKTEDATEHRKRKARDEEGRLFLSQELPQAMTLLGAGVFLYFAATYYNNILTGFFRRFFTDYASVDINLDNFGVVMMEMFKTIMLLFLPIGAILLVTTIFFTMVQTGFFFSTVTLKLNWDRIVPSWDNFRKKTVFSRMQVIQLAKIAVKILIVGIFSYFLMVSTFESLKHFMGASLYNWYVELAHLNLKVVFFMGLFFLVFAIPDWFIQKSEYERNLKMTKQEIKQEFKELEGDPLIKAKIRQRAREMAMSDVINKVKEADVVITNPTHYACAIGYDYSLMDAPKLLAKGKDRVALKIREIATENGIPIVENKPLARGLYANVEVDQYVPVEYYGAIAEILSALEKYKSVKN